MSLLFRAVDLLFLGRSADGRKFLHDTLLVHGVISPIAQSEQLGRRGLVRLRNACTWYSFDLILHLKALSFDTGNFMSFTRHCFFRSQVCQGLSSGRSGTPLSHATLFRVAALSSQLPRRLPHVRRRAAFRRPERRRGGGSGQRASERASPRFAEAGAGDLSHRRRRQ